MASDVGTYYGVPALIIGTATAVPLIFGAVGLTYLFIGYFVWLLWHYGRQNLGVLSLVSIGTKTPAPSKIERHLYDAACIAGLMGALATLPQAKESVLAPVLNISYWVGLGMMVAIVAACTLVFFGNYRRGDTNQRLIMTALVSVFFVPSFLPTNFNVAAYAHAHALQYFVIMYTLAGDRQQGNLVIRLGALSLLAVVGYYISIWLNDKTLLGDWVTVGSAAGIGITMTHFFLDSRLWRLREPFQRAAVKESFSFLFK
jgi:hypothetical protein